MSNVTHIESAEITIRAARAEDMGELARVAGRDTQELPEGTLLVAKVGSRRACRHLPLRRHDHRRPVPPHGRAGRDAEDPRRRRARARTAQSLPAGARATPADARPAA